MAIAVKGQYLGLGFPIARRLNIDSAMTGVWADAVAKKNICGVVMAGMRRALAQGLPALG